MRKQLTPKNSRKLKKKEKMNGPKKECMNNLLEIVRTRIRTTHEDGWEKVIWKDALRLWYAVPRNSLYELTISSATLTKLASHHLEWFEVQKWDYNHIVSECGKPTQKEYKHRQDISQKTRYCVSLKKRQWL